LRQKLTLKMKRWTNLRPLNEKMDKLEVKIDALSGLMAQLLDATQQKQE